MEREVYGDLLFFINFCMDFQCLFLSARCLRRPFSLWRGALFAALGALYAVAALFLPIHGVMAFLLDLGVCLLMCIGTFAGKSVRPRQILWIFLIYFGVSFAVGGVMSGMAGLLSHIEAPLGQSKLQIGNGLFYLLAALAGLSTYFWGRYCKKKGRETHGELRLVLRGREVCADCLFDSANFLKDPIGGRPVALLSDQKAKEIFPASFLEAARNSDLSALPREFLNRVRPVPSISATGEKLLFAIAPDAAYLNVGHGENPTDLLIAPAFSGFGEYEVLLPAAVM